VVVHLLATAIEEGRDPSSMSGTPAGTSECAHIGIRTWQARNDLTGVPWLMIGEEPSAAPNGGSRAGCSTRSTQIE
jgi:hypothetical protein